jgi:hypothetical protein
MRRAWVRSGWTFVWVSLATVACSRTPERHVQTRPYVPTAAEQRRIDERRAEERRAEERREANRREEERARRPRAIGGGPADRETPASPSSRIAAARCDREVKCNRVGAPGKYDSQQACVAALKRDIQHDLDGADCTNGVRAKELNDCLQAIRDERCGALDFDTAIRLRACRAETMCLR